VDASKGDPVEQVLTHLPAGVPWVVEAVGRPDTLSQAVQMLRPTGTVVAVGLGRVGETFSVPINDLVQRQKRVVGSLYGSAVPQLDLPVIFDLYRSGLLPLDELVGERYRLDQVQAGFDALAGGAPGRAVVLPGERGA
jgi:Zn-dependent alcohol dehydrogenase